MNGIAIAVPLLISLYVKGVSSYERYTWTYITTRRPYFC